jgi:hypothetical protein
VAATVKRGGMLGLAVALTLGLAVSASQAAKPKKAKTEAEVEGFRELPGDQSEIFGDVHSRKSKCEKRRAVRLVYVGDQGDPMLEPTTTDATGDWEIDLGMVAIPAGPYVLKVERKKVGRDDRKLVCKAATSPEHSFDEA